MATELAPAPPLTAARLWQVPAFLLGLIAFAAVTVGRPYLVGLSPNSPTRLLGLARTDLIVEPPNADRAIEYTQRIVDLPDLASKTRAEAHLLLGWAQLSKCNSLGPNEASSLAAQARHHLERAEQLGVSDSDRSKMALRLAKAWMLTGTDIQQVIRLLAKTADTADDPFEAYGLLAEAYAKLPQPDPAGLLEAVRQQVARAPDTMDAGKLSRARLRLAELLLQSQNVKEARLVLSRIGTDAPSDILLPSRNLLARCHEDAKDWPAAARAWEQIIADARLAGADKARVFYALGNAHFFNRQHQEAVAAWQAAMAMGGPEGQAAALRMAELKFTADPKAALAAISASLKSVVKPEDYQNPIIGVDDLRGLFERVSEQLRSKSDFESAVELAKLYAKIAAPGRAPALQGLAAAAWADALAAQGQHDAAMVPRADAARCYSFAAAQLSGQEAIDLLWQSADLAIKSKEWTVALDALGRFVQLDGISAERVADAWLAMGRLYEEQKNYAEAKAAFQKCLKSAEPWRHRARYSLALIALNDARRDEKARQDPKMDEADRLTHELRAKVHFDDAEKLLQDNLAEMRQAAQVDPAVQEQTVYCLADVAFERADYANAEARLNGALQEYPSSSATVRAQYLLALCIWKRAVEVFNGLANPNIAAAQRQLLQKKYLEDLSQAESQFGQVERALFAKSATGLDNKEQEMLRRSAFSVGEIMYLAEKYNEAMKRFEDLAQRYKGQVEELHAIHQLWQCQYYYLKDSKKSLETLERLRDALEKVADREFDNSSPQHVRAHWVDKIVQMGKAMNQ